MKNYKRLLHFLKGRMRYFYISLIMILIVQLLNFISPLLVKTLLDDYIMGIEYDLVEVKTADEETTNYNNRYFKQVRFLDEDDEIVKDVSIVLYKTGIYFVDEKVTLGSKEMIDNKLIITTKDNLTYEYQTVKLTSNEIFSFYNPMLHLILLIIGLIFIKSVVTIICNFVQQMCTNRVINRIVLEERLRGMEVVERLPIKEFEAEPAGKMANRITRDVDGILTMYRQILNMFFSAFLSFIFAYIGMFYLDVKLALLSILIYPFIYLWIRFFLKHLKKIAVKVNEASSMLTAKINEIINGINILQIFNFKKQTVKEFNVINKEYRDEQLKDVKLNLKLGWNLINVIQGLITTLVVVYFGLQHTVIGDIVVTAGLIYAYNQYILKLVEPVHIIFTQISTFQNSHVQVDRYHKLIESELEDNSISDIEKYKGKVEFKNVTFRYVEDTYVLNNINFIIDEKQMVALVGHTGSGKSSLMNLLLRFYDLELGNGTIYIDEKDISKLEKRTYRKHIGIVLQEPVLFKGTICSNIKFGKDVSDEEVEKVLSMIGGDKIIKKFPKGIHQEITRAGLNMSAGEKQIISLARVLIHDPSILIMDEATSHIDLETESMIKKALKVVAVNRTVIIIAHRLSTIYDADNIIVLDHGRIVEEGTHKELLKQKGTYYNIYEAQKNGIDDAA